MFCRLSSESAEHEPRKQKPQSREEMVHWERITKSYYPQLPLPPTTIFTTLVDDGSENSPTYR